MMRRRASVASFSSLPFSELAYGPNAYYSNNPYVSSNPYANATNYSGYTPDLSILNKPQSLDSWCDNKLNIMKRQIDQELRGFLVDLVHVKNSLELQKICQQILKATVEDLKEGKYDFIQKKLRELNNDVKTPQMSQMKSYVRKLMFIFSK